MHYLLSLWQRMVASVPYVKATEPHLLERFIPQITTAYITSRLEAVPIIFRDGLEDPLDDPSALLQQLDQLSTIGKFNFLSVILREPPLSLRSSHSNRPMRVREDVQSPGDPLRPVGASLPRAVDGQWTHLCA